MPVEIEIRGDVTSKKYQDAKLIKKFFANTINMERASGNILIICNNTLSGYRSSKIDLIIIGNFQNYECKIRTKANYLSYKGASREFDIDLRRVSVKSFCFTLEIDDCKFEELMTNESNFLVKKNGQNEKFANENHCNTVKEYFLKSLKFSPFICHFIWYKNIELNSITSFFKGKRINLKKYNYLPNEFNFNYNIKLACFQKTPYFPVSKDGEIKGDCVFKCLPKFKDFNYSEINPI